MTRATRRLVRERAENCCEYCQLHQDDAGFGVLHVEHVIPTVHGGSDDLENLALACIHCNLHKGTNLSGIDPEAQRRSRLFHPRRDRWDEHFEWRGIYIVGKTAIGRTSVRVLKMNSEAQLTLRSS